MLFLSLATFIYLVLHVCLLVHALPVRKPVLHVFGDSLSDTGRLKQLTHGLVPPSYYWNGRFSSGPVWSEYLSLLLDYSLSNHAVGLAKSSGVRRWFMNFVPLDPPTTRDQIEELAQANSDSRSLLVQSMDIAVLEIGANDANSAFVEIESGNQTVYEFADQLSEEIVLQLEMLQHIGFKRILVANLPALQHTPIVKRKSRSLLAATTVSVYNQMLDFKAKEWLQQANLDSFAVIDLGKFLTIAMSPSVTQSLGITNITSFCASGQWLSLFEDQITFLDFMKYVVSESGAEVSTDCEDPASVFFFDPIHPSERVHRLFGYYAFNLFQQVLSGDKNSNAANDLLTEDNLLLLISTHGLSKPSPKPASI